MLLWVILRWAKHDLKPASVTQEPCDQVYFYGNDVTASSLKHGWLMKTNIQLHVLGNEPLTTLAAGFRRLLQRNIAARLVDLPEKSVTHDEVLKLFDDALEKDNWPDCSGDGAVRCANPRKAPLPNIFETEKRSASVLDAENPGECSEEPRSKKPRNKGSQKGASGSKKGAAGRKHGEGSKGGRSKGGGRKGAKSGSTS